MTEHARGTFTVTMTPSDAPAERDGVALTCLGLPEPFRGDRVHTLPDA